jgi:hypothetical protein
LLWEAARTFWRWWFVLTPEQRDLESNRELTDDEKIDQQFW